MAADDRTLHDMIDDAFARGDLASAIVHLQSRLADVPDEFDSWMKLAAIQRASGRSAEALQSVDRALAIQPLFYIALLFKGSLLQAEGSPGKAAEFFAAALFQAEGQTPSPIVARQLEAARRAIDVHADHVAASARRALYPNTDEPRAQALIERMAQNVIRRRPVYHQEPTHYRLPGLPDVEFFDEYRPDWIEQIEASTAAIRTEYEALVAVNAKAAAPYIDLRPDYPAGPWAALNRSTDWNAIHLIRYGEIVQENACHCPVTMALFSRGQQPDIAGLAPNLMFSVLAPRTHIPPHHGVANFRSVLHLPLIVPGDCTFRVGADTRSWEPGRAWIFDDTIEHEAWNNADYPRVVLIADVWRPELDTLEQNVVRSFMRAVGSEPHLGAL